MAKILDENGISGAPVLDPEEHLLGVVSKSDLVHHQLDGDRGDDEYSYYRGSSVEVLPKGFHVEVPDRTAVRDIMTPTIIQANEDTPVSELALVMRQKHIHRIFITRKNKLCGIVTTMDLLRVLENGWKVKN